MRMIVGFLKPSEGNVIVNNYDIQDYSETCKSFIGYVPEGAPLYEEMTAFDFLKFSAKVRRINKKLIPKSLEM